MDWLTQGIPSSTVTVELVLPPPRGRMGLRVALSASHAGRKQTRVLSPDTPLVVGRMPPAALCIEDKTLSREHARFLLCDGRVWVEDLGSKNGTFFEGRRIARTELSMGDEITLGRVVLRLQALGTAGQSLELEGEETLRHHVEEELARARQFARPFALLRVRKAGEDEKAPGEGPEGAWLEAVRSRLRSVDRMALYGPSAVDVLLPETGPQTSQQVAHAIAAPLKGEGDGLLVGVACYPEAGSTADELFEAAREAARRASPERPVERSQPAASLLVSREGAEGAVIAGRAMRPLLETVARVAASRLPVILQGETGTGKEVLARLIHEGGPRKGQRIVRVNCGAIPKDLVESTLFGHERGAFTGALHQQKGVFEEADGGTVFLDEIGELPPPAQAALLRVLEVGAFSRVGSSRELAVDVRVVAATHRNLETMSESGAFRADLYYRLSGVVLEIPPLRERRDEIEPLARRFLRLANEANGRQVEGLTPEALALLRAYGWPGNVRELRNVLERAVVVTRGALIGPEDLPTRVRTVMEHPAVERPSVEPTSPEPVSAPRAEPSLEPPQARGKVQQYETRILQEALEATGWRRSEAARRLGMPVRTLSYRMKVLGLKKPE